MTKRPHLEHNSPVRIDLPILDWTHVVIDGQLVRKRIGSPPPQPITDDSTVAGRDVHAA